MIANTSDSIQTARQHHPFQIYFLVTAGLVIVADYLFYLRPIGITVTLFIVTLAVAATIINASEIRRSDFIQGSLARVVLLLPGLETTNLLSAVLGVSGLLIFTLFIQQKGGRDILVLAGTVPGFIPGVPLRFIQDTRLALGASTGCRVQVRSARVLGNWFLPIVLTLVFLTLFVVANPLIEDAFLRTDYAKFFDYFDGLRIGFWLGAGALCWGYVRFSPNRRSINTIPKEAALPASASGGTGGLMSAAQIVRALVLFNLLFAIQTGLDIAYLWTGVRLPDGLSYAEYAQRGAYTLILTALLAAAFVLYATRPAAGDRDSSLKRVLLLLWTAQNALLVLSCVLRLSLYVDVYALTYWRVAAFIWMMLVFAGLVLIGIRVLARQSNRWLITANIWVLLLTLYAASFVNIPAMIANHNVSVERAGKGPGLDRSYLLSLGEEALPAIDRMLAYQNDVSMDNRSGWRLSILKHGREKLAAQFNRDQRDWRLWSLRRIHLKQYLIEFEQTRTNRPDVSIY